MVGKRIVLGLLSVASERAQFRGINVVLGYSNPEKPAAPLRFENILKVPVMERLETPMSAAFIKHCYTTISPSLMRNPIPVTHPRAQQSIFGMDNTTIGRPSDDVYPV